MIGQVEILLVELVEKGGPWGIVGALLFAGWQMWRKIEPKVAKHLELKEREVAARERIPAQAEKNQAVGEKLAGAVDKLTAEIERVRKNGVKNTDRVGG